MKKYLLLFFLLINNTGFAEYTWKKIAYSIDGNVTYVDDRTIKVVGEMRYYLMLTDYAKPTSFGHLSSKNYMQVNCANYNIKLLKNFYYDEPMANGEPSEINSTESEWVTFLPGSLGEKIVKYVCDIK
jgi:hypothetical protein|tara:strand:- start:484 stop:867 length:384 start_codon:yes stop_codon:yes gene_type:complete